MIARYEIDSDNAVKVFYEGSEVPSLYQPHWPSGELWENAAEATSWAELYIAAINDEAAPYAPVKRGEEGRPKPTAEQKEAIRLAEELATAAVTDEEVEAAREAIRVAYAALAG